MVTDKPHWCWVNIVLSGSILNVFKLMFSLCYCYCFIQITVSNGSMIGWSHDNQKEGTDCDIYPDARMTLNKV